MATGLKRPAAACSWTFIVLPVPSRGEIHTERNARESNAVSMLDGAASVLLTPDVFRAAVLQRDARQCVICRMNPPQLHAPFPCGPEDEGGVDVYHIMAPELWEDGGYYLDNGVTLCSWHQLEARRTLLPPEEIRRAAGIATRLLPPQLPRDTAYDRWGNPVLASGARLRGEMFYQDQVQVALRAGDVLDQFIHLVKYPRTRHLPWSPGIGDDDLVLLDLDRFIGQEVVVTAKLDGENATLYHDSVHARWLSEGDQSSLTFLRSLHGRIGQEIPQGYRVCGENLHIRHAIRYQHLSADFLVHSIWDAQNRCLSWADTLEMSARLALDLVPVLYLGLWDEAVIRALYAPMLNGDPCEGYVVRLAGQFDYADFGRCLAKYVAVRTAP